jgi:putative restriction endonuclease
MEKLNQSAINDVLNTSPALRTKVLYKFLVDSISHRGIERQEDELMKNHGWSSWKIVRFFGFTDDDKGKFRGLTLQALTQQLQNTDLEEIADYQLENGPYEKAGSKDGQDILRELKTRIGQAKLRKRLILNYEGKCALCDISLHDLLMASHIKSWSESAAEERVDPSNAILLCRLHDGLFDKGYLSFSDDFTPIFRNKKLLQEQGVSTALVFRLPKQGHPSKVSLAIHRTKHKL